MTVQQKESRGILERHFQSGILTLLLALVAWGTSSISYQSTEIALLKLTVANLTSTLDKLADQPFLSRDDFSTEMKIYNNRLDLAELDQKKINNTLSEIDNRIRRIETYRMFLEHKRTPEN